MRCGGNTVVSKTYIDPKFNNFSNQDILLKNGYFFSCFLTFLALNISLGAFQAS